MYKNFMKHNFKNYYAPDGKGGYKEVNRSECFTYDINSFSGNYPQQWYWDIENSFAIRLEQNRVGKRICNEARAERRRALKAHLEQFGCVSKECVTCKGWDVVSGNESKCDSCAKHITFFPLDAEYDSGDGGKAVHYDIESGEDTNPEHQAEATALHKILRRALQEFNADEQLLWTLLVAGTKKKVIAARFGWTLDQLSYRQLKLYAKLRSKKALKDFFEKD